MFQPYEFVNLWFQTNAPSGAVVRWGQKLNESSTGPRLKAWTTKSPIRGNHWFPLGCRALLGSVKIWHLLNSLSDWKTFKSCWLHITLHFWWLLSKPTKIFFTQLFVHNKVLYPKYSKHWSYTVASTIDCGCSKMLNHGLNHGFFLSLFKLIPCPINWIVCVLAYLNFIFEF